MGKKEHPSPHGTGIYVIKYDAYKKLEQVTCTSYKLTEQGICTSHKLNSGHICTSYTLSKGDTCTSYTLPYICTSYKIPKTLNTTSEFQCGGNRALNSNNKALEQLSTVFDTNKNYSIKTGNVIFTRLNDLRNIINNEIAERLRNNGYITEKKVVLTKAIIPDTNINYTGDKINHNEYVQNIRNSIIKLYENKISSLHDTNISNITDMNQYINAAPLSGDVISAANFSNYYNALSSILQDCICYADCTMYKVCKCYGFCGCNYY